jgi:hypothetical protein
MYPPPIGLLPRSVGFIAKKSSTALFLGLQENQLTAERSRFQLSCACNSQRPARSKSLQLKSRSPVRSAISRNSRTFAHHHVAGDTSVSVVMTSSGLSVARVAVNFGSVRFTSAPRCLKSRWERARHLRQWGNRVSVASARRDDRLPAMEHRTVSRNTRTIFLGFNMRMYVHATPEVLL